jgi:hypothetical protein
MDGLMTSPIVRGSPYGTMIYDKAKLLTRKEQGYATLAMELSIGTVQIDQTGKLLPEGDVTTVEYEMEIFVPGSDFTWLVFVSEPVQVERLAANNGGSLLRLLPSTVLENNDDDSPLIIRVALSQTCSTGTNPTFCQQNNRCYAGQNTLHADRLRRHSHLYPGPEVQFFIEVPIGEDATTKNYAFENKPEHRKIQ